MPQFRIGTAFGIPIKLDLTFLLVLPLFAWLIGSQVEDLTTQFNELLGVGIAVSALTEPAYLPWLIGTVAAVGLFVGVILHELGHSLVAMRYGYPIDSITLWIFGGIAQFTEMPEDWRHEFSIAVAGPVVSLLLGVGLGVGYLLLPATLPVGQFVVGYLALMNVALAVFNLLPAFPMDGGRILRALLARGRPFAQATKIAAEVGKALAVLMGLVGLFQFNLVLIGIAFFVFIGASREAQQTVMKAAFEGVSVRNLMTPVSEVETVNRETSLAVLIDRMFSERHTGYPVLDNNELVGVVTLSDAQSVRPVERDAYVVGDVMTTDLLTIPVEADAMDALTKMQEHDVGRLLVAENGEFAGLLTRSDLMTAFDIIQSSGSLPGSGSPVADQAVDGAPDEFRFDR